MYDLSSCSVHKWLLRSCLSFVSVSICTAGGRGQDQHILSKHGTWSLSSFVTFTKIWHTGHAQHFGTKIVLVCDHMPLSSPWKTRFELTSNDGKEAKEVCWYGCVLLAVTFTEVVCVSSWRQLALQIMAKTHIKNTTFHRCLAVQSCTNLNMVDHPMIKPLNHQVFCNTRWDLFSLTFVAIKHIQ